MVWVNKAAYVKCISVIASINNDIFRAVEVPTIEKAAAAVGGVVAKY